jgi:hypothetical protein
MILPLKLSLSLFASNTIPSLFLLFKYLIFPSISLSLSLEIVGSCMKVRGAREALNPQCHPPLEFSNPVLPRGFSFVQAWIQDSKLSYF